MSTQICLHKIYLQGCKKRKEINSTLFPLNLYSKNNYTTKLFSSLRIFFFIVKVFFFSFSEREYGGIQVCWNRGQTPTFGQRWNPWCSDIPWTIFAHHPLIYNPKENETTYFSVDDFYECLLDSTKKCYGRKRPNENPTIVEGSILLPNYINIPSMIFNRTSLGYSRDRNGFCF